MALSGKLFREITLADVQELVTSRLAEDTIIEYKRQALHPSTPPKQLDDEKDELLTDLISLANASGGHVFFGIETDSQERASGFVPMSGVRAKALANQLRDTCGAHIKPTIENVEIQPFCLDDKKDEWLVIVVIPASARKPHMSAFRHQTKFFIRLGNAKRAMTYEEILQGFTVRQDQYFAQIISRLDGLTAERSAQLRTPAELEEMEWWEITKHRAPRGVSPDEMVLPQAADLASGRDPVLAHAVGETGATISPEDAGKLFPYEWPKE